MSEDKETLNAQTQRLAALGFMVASVCHEVSNPLAAVSSMLQILRSRRAVTPETMDKGLASIAANIARVLAITKKLGDFSRVGSDTLVPVFADAAMEEALALLRHSASGAHVRVTYDGAPEAAVLARPGNLQEILFNLLLNAAQAMGGSGTIEARTRVMESARMLISIRDHGPGIAPQHLARLFEPFFTTKPAGQGTGLGLAISAQVAQELDGGLRAFNAEGGGACFEIDLPLCP